MFTLRGGVLTMNVPCHPPGNCKAYCTPQDQSIHAASIISKYRIAASTFAIRPGDFLRLRSVASLAVEYRPNDHDRVDSSGLLIPIGTLFNSPATGSRLFGNGHVVAEEKSAYTSWATAGAHLITNDMSVLDFAPKASDDRWCMPCNRPLSYVSIALLSLITREHRVRESHYTILADEECIEGVLIRPQDGDGDGPNEFRICIWDRRLVRVSPVYGMGLSGHSGAEDPRE
ncbi:hypothetical protein EDB83DRAFT_2315590 [Lactarius deliciosus]|nr:hypothetical protein EDB83DRAFT_2315590 [Lactarius deliciosus]